MGVCFGSTPLDLEYLELVLVSKSRAMPGPYLGGVHLKACTAAQDFGYPINGYLLRSSEPVCLGWRNDG